MILPHPFTSPDELDTHYANLVHDLVTRATDLARRIHIGATAAHPTPENPQDQTPEPHPQSDEAKIAAAEAAAAAMPAFDRAVRIVRRTISLARHIAAHPISTTLAAAQAAAQTAQARPQRHKTPETPTTTRARQNIARATEHHPGLDRDALFAYVLEHTEDRDFEDPIDGRNIVEIINQLCDELGIATSENPLDDTPLETSTPEHPTRHHHPAPAAAARPTQAFTHPPSSPHHQTPHHHQSPGPPPH